MIRAVLSIGDASIYPLIPRCVRDENTRVSISAGENDDRIRRTNLCAFLFNSKEFGFDHIPAMSRPGIPGYDFSP